MYWHGKIGEDLREDMPALDELRFIRANLRESLPYEWRLPDDFFQFTHYLRVLEKLDYTSSPGYPYKLRSPTNADFFGRKYGINSTSRVQEVWELVLLQVRERRADPIFLFIKPEPHKVSKKNRKRLISSVSIIDQIIDHMLFDEFNNVVIQDAANGPIKAGWSIQSGGWKVMPTQGMSIDKTAWDWTAKLWLFQLCLDYRKECLVGPGADVWYELASWRYRKLFLEAEFCLPNGEFRLQKRPGVMKSGCVNTIIDNSMMQMILHYRVCFQMGLEPGWIWCLGDDTRQSLIAQRQQYLDLLSQFCVVKECTDSCEFAGYRFVKGARMEPLYKGKHAFVMLHCAPKVQEDIARSYSLP
uniref:RNA-directed RNA polymerase C-terminal domain-containing protein n=1 Tax=Riboviria sp. TaxID=2585031 RepID=A0A8K1U1Y8_9VIRU|nr:MAG: hypothetical protein 1 [Riboviria sp.]